MYDDDLGTTQEAPEPEFDVIVDGQVMKVPQSELLKGYSRHADYTRKTQELAQRERGYTGRISEYEKALSDVANFLDSEEQVRTYVARRFAQQQAAPQTYLTPDQLQRELQKMQTQQNEQLLALQTEMAVNQQAQQYGTKIDAKLAALKTANPQVFFRPGMERLIREEVMASQPQNVDEAIRAFERIVGEYAREIAKTHAAPQVRGIEPPGGIATMPSPQEDFSDVRDPRLRQQVIEDLMRGGLRG